MTEARPISYNATGFKLGLGGLSGVRKSSGTAASSFLDTLIASVPSAKALLPTLIPGVLKPGPKQDAGLQSQQGEGFPSSAPQESGVPTKSDEAAPTDAVKLAEERENKELPTTQQPESVEESKAADAEEDVIDLISDSEDESSCKVQQIQEKRAEEQKPIEDTAAAQPAPAEFIPVVKTSNNRDAAADSNAQTAAPGSADALAGDEEIRRLGQKPYWLPYLSFIESPMLRLHQEIIELCELVQPTPEEAAARRAAVVAVTEVVTSIWPKARCEVFGSTATGLYVPTSDIDLVILDSGCANVQQGLKALANTLSMRSVGRNITTILSARVPIVKFETVDYGNLSFDVSFDVANGPQAAVLVGEMTSSWPMMRPIILILKLFLQQRELNEVYTGGIGSYALITLVAGFLQLHASRRGKQTGNGNGGNGSGGNTNGGGDGPPSAGKRGAGGRGGTGGGGGGQQQQSQQPMSGTAGTASKGALSGVVEPGLGVLLVDFFRFYGRVVNVPDVGISCAGGGQFFRKTDKTAPPPGRYSYDGWLNKERAFMLAVEDPKDPDNDVCRNSHGIMRVKTAFEFAYQMLTAPSRRDESLLARILRLGPILASRPRPIVDHLRKLRYYSAAPVSEEELHKARQQRRQQRKERRQQQQQQQPLTGAQGSGGAGGGGAGDGNAAGGEGAGDGGAAAAAAGGNGGAAAAAGGNGSPAGAGNGGQAGGGQAEAGEASPTGRQAGKGKGKAGGNGNGNGRKRGRGEEAGGEAAGAGAGAAAGAGAGPSSAKKQPNSAKKQVQRGRRKSGAQQQQQGPASTGKRRRSEQGGGKEGPPAGRGEGAAARPRKRGRDTSGSPKGAAARGPSAVAAGGGEGAVGERTPGAARGAKRQRMDSAVKQGQGGGGNGRGRDRDQDRGGRPRDPHPRQPYNNHTAALTPAAPVHQPQFQSPPTRRMAPMHLTGPAGGQLPMQAAPAYQPPMAPAFHPGYAPVPMTSAVGHGAQDHHRGRGGREQPRQGGGGGGGGGGGRYAHEPHPHFSQPPLHHHDAHCHGGLQQHGHAYRNEPPSAHSYPRYDGVGNDYRGGGVGGGGGYGRGPPQLTPMVAAGARGRAPISVPPPQHHNHAPPPMRGHSHNHPQRTHVYFD